MKIDDWRQQIDAIDTALLHLLNRRTELALEVGRLKDASGAGIRVPEREAEILERLKRLNPGELEPESIEAIYRVIFAESVRRQMRRRLAAV